MSYLEQVQEIYDIKVSLFDTLPREIGIWKKWCDTRSEYREFVKLCNGVTDCYCSVYKQTLRWKKKEIGDAMENGAVVDKVFLDFDTKWGYESMLVAHEFLQKKDIIHRINVSGRWDKEKITSFIDENGERKFEKRKEDVTSGFHVYYWIVPDLENPKNALYNLQKDMCDYISGRLESGWGVETIEEQWEFDESGNRKKIPEWTLPDYQIYAPVDRRIWGDVLRISRIPNTWNPKRQRYCIPITEKVINDFSINEIQELSKKQYFPSKDDKWMGFKLLKVPSEFDTKTVLHKFGSYVSIPDENPDPNIMQNYKLPICVKKLLCDSTLDVDRRFWLLVYLRDRGITMEEAVDVFQKILDPEFSYHSIYIERQPWHVYRGNQQKTYMLNCYKFSDLCNCADSCHKCFRYEKRHPVYK